jgi:hypothetical protein
MPKSRLYIAAGPRQDEELQCSRSLRCGTDLANNLTWRYWKQRSDPTQLLHESAADPNQGLRTRSPVCTPQ